MTAALVRATPHARVLLHCVFIGCVIWVNMDRLSIVSVIPTPISSSDYFVFMLSKGIHLSSIMKYKIFLLPLYFLRKIENIHLRGRLYYSKLLG